MKKQPVIIGSRGSALALWQARWVEQQLGQQFPGLKTEVRILTTKGDKILDSPLSKIGDKGLFTKELEHALLEKTIDMAVHSLKDLPTALTTGLVIGAIAEREDCREAFIPRPDGAARTLAEIGRGGTVATGSLRRQSQLLNFRPDLHTVEIRGNVDTRIEKLKNSDWDGMMLAVAGLKRLGKQDLIAEILPTDLILPAVGQGALAIEIRADDPATAELVETLHHGPTSAATTAERSLLRRLEGGCQIPVGAHGRVENGTLKLDAFVGNLSGSRAVRSSISGAPADAERLGTSLAEQLLKAGGDEILDEVIRLSR